MGEVFLAVLPGVLAHMIIPAVAAVVVGAVARGRSRTFGVVGFAIMALGTLVGGVLSGMIPMIMQRAELPPAVLGPLITVVSLVFSAMAVIFLVLAIVSGSRVRPGPGMPTNR